MKGSYVDGYLVPVKKDRLEEYRELAELAAEVWMEHGALHYVECVAEDVKPGKVTSFPQAVQLKDDEVVVFAWIVYESREKRDEVNRKAMNDPRLTSLDPTTHPLDPKRMFWGGFEKLVEFGGAGN